MRFGNKLKNSATPMAHAKRPGSKEYFFGAGNNINAGSKRELMQTIASLLAEASEGNIVDNDNSETYMTTAEAIGQFTEAFNNRHSPAWKDYGATIAHDLMEHVERDGFMRKLLKKLEVQQGSFPRHRVQQLQVMAITATGTGQVSSQIVREKFILPPEFQIVADALVTRQVINQTPGDILDERYNEALMAIMTAEDKTVKAVFDASVGINNPLVYVSGGLTPAIISSMSARVYSQVGSNGGSILLAADYWEDILTKSDFAGYYDPVSKLELIQNGVLGRFFGRDFITDGFRLPQLKVLATGELYVLAQPELLGGYTERGPVESTEIDGAIRNMPGARGWSFVTDVSIAGHNAKSIQKAVRA